MFPCSCLLFSSLCDSPLAVSFFLFYFDLLNMLGRLGLASRLRGMEAFWAYDVLETWKCGVVYDDRPCMADLPAEEFYVYTIREQSIDCDGLSYYAFMHHMFMCSCEIVWS